MICNLYIFFHFGKFRSLEIWQTAFVSFLKTFEDLYSSRNYSFIWWKSRIIYTSKHTQKIAICLIWVRQTVNMCQINFAKNFYKIQNTIFINYPFMYIYIFRVLQDLFIWYQKCWKVVRKVIFNIPVKQSELKKWIGQSVINNRCVRFRNSSWFIYHWY